MKPDFENYLMKKHAEQHIGTKETLVDGFNDWLVDDLDVDTLIDYANSYTKEYATKVEFTYSSDNK